MFACGHRHRHTSRANLARLSEETSQKLDGLSALRKLTLVLKRIVVGLARRKLGSIAEGIVSIDLLWIAGVPLGLLQLPSQNIDADSFEFVGPRGLRQVA